jgi:hypothetical protein
MPCSGIAKRELQELVNQRGAGDSGTNQSGLYELRAVITESFLHLAIAILVVDLGLVLLGSLLFLHWLHAFAQVFAKSARRNWKSNVLRNANELPKSVQNDRQKRPTPQRPIRQGMSLCA